VFSCLVLQAARALVLFVFDIVEAAKPEEVQKAAMIIRSYGHSSTETLVATPWKDFVSALAG
jgi:uncharacterized protein with GYD domain